MMATVHIAAGVALGAVLLRPALALAAGAASHLVLDSIPHGRLASDHESYLTVARIDGLTALMVLAVALLLLPRRWRLAAAIGAVAAVALDADKPAEHFLGWDLWPAWIDAVHHGVQREHPAYVVADMAVLAVSLSATYLLARNHRLRVASHEMAPVAVSSAHDQVVEEASVPARSGGSLGRWPIARGGRPQRPSGT